MTSEGQAQKFHTDDVRVSASNWLKHISRVGRPIRITILTWVVTRHQYGISALVSQASFRGETSGRTRADKGWAVKRARPSRKV